MTYVRMEDSALLGQPDHPRFSLCHFIGKNCSCVPTGETETLQCCGKNSGTSEKHCHLVHTDVTYDSMSYSQRPLLSCVMQCIVYLHLSRPANATWVLQLGSYSLCSILCRAWGQQKIANWAHLSVVITV